MCIWTETGESSQQTSRTPGSCRRTKLGGTPLRVPHPEQAEPRASNEGQGAEDVEQENELDAGRRAFIVQEGQNEAAEGETEEGFDDSESGGAVCNALSPIIQEDDEENGSSPPAALVGRYSQGGASHITPFHPALAKPFWALMNYVSHLL